MVKTQHFHCRECGFNPWSRNQDSACCMVWQKKEKEKKILFMSMDRKWQMEIVVRRELLFSH